MAKKSPSTGTLIKSGKKLRYALIGVGGISTAHMTPLSKRSDVEIIGGADIRPEVMKAKFEPFNVPLENQFDNYPEMLEKLQPDAVSVCTPNGVHMQPTIDALKAGAHVIVEKPMAMNAKQAQAMLDASIKYSRKLVIGFQYRYSSHAEYIRKANEEGLLGKIVYARVQALRRRGIPNWGVFVNKELQGGGPMIDIGVHALEATHFVMGAPKPVSAVGSTYTYIGDKPSDKIACAWKGWDYKNYTVEDLAVGQIRFDNGATLTIEASFAAHIERDVMGFALMGEKGGAQTADLHEGKPTIFRDQAGYMVNQTPGWLAQTGWGDNFTPKMNNFVDHVLYNKPTMAPAEHGVMVQKMLDSIYESAEKGGREVIIK